MAMEDNNNPIIFATLSAQLIFGGSIGCSQITSRFKRSLVFKLEMHNALENLLYKVCVFIGLIMDKKDLSSSQNPDPKFALDKFSQAQEQNTVIYFR